MVSTMIDLMPGETPTYVPVTRAELTKPDEKPEVAAAAQERQGAFVFIMAAEARRAYAAKRTPEQESAMAPAERSLAGLGELLASPATTEAVNPTPVNTREQKKLSKKNPPRIRIEGNTLTPLPGVDKNDGPSYLGKGEHEVTTFYNRTPDGKINLKVQDNEGNPSLITVDEATFVEMYMLGCKADFDAYGQLDAKPSTGSFLNNGNVQVMMKEFVEKNGDWTQMSEAATTAVKAAKTEVVREMPIIHGFEPAAVRDAAAKVAELEAKLPADEDSKALEAKLTPLTSAKDAAQRELDNEKDETKKVELKKKLDSATQAEETAKATLAVRQAQEAEVRAAKETHSQLRDGAKDLAKEPPSDEALTKHINTMLNGEVESKVTGLQTDIAKLREEQQKDKMIGAAGAQERIDAKQKEIDAKQKEIDNFKLMTEHPEMTAAFVRQMQQGEVSKDIVVKIQRALVEGNASDLMKEVSGQAFKDKLAELMKKAEASKDPKMKDFLEKYRPLLVTGGIAVFVLYQIIIQAMNKEDRNGGH